jgi:restriction system protein
MYLDPISAILGVGAGLLFLAIYFYILLRLQRTRRVQVLRRVDLDRLDGAEFETFVADLLTRRGYRVQHTGKSGDLGVDLIAEKKPYRYAVQVKRQAQPVSRRAVSDAVAGKAHYGCNAAMVVTNNSFSPGARELARSTHCQLVDRMKLADWLLEVRT